MQTFRRISILVFVAVLVAMHADSLWAAQAEDARFLLDGRWRADGFYLSWNKILLSWLVLLAWIATVDWANRDLLRLNLNWRRWNPILVGSFVAAMLLLWLLPWFWFGFFLLLAGYLGPLTAYVLYRNARLPSSLRVLTPEHLRWWLATRVRKVGIKMSVEAHDPNLGGAPVIVFGCGGANPQDDAGRLLAARQSAGLPIARKVLAQALNARASAILLDYTQTNVGLRYMIDGVWVPQEVMEREAADPVLESLKILSGLNPQDRRGRQEGKFGVEYSVIRQEVLAKADLFEQAFRKKLTIDLTKKWASSEKSAAQLQQEVAAEVEQRVREKFATPIGEWTPIDKDRLPKLLGVEALNPVTSLETVKCPATLASQGTQGGERVVIQFEVKTARLATLEDLGMRSKMQEQLKEVVGRPRGFVLLSAMPAGGLRTTTKVLLHDLDRFMREFVSIEDVANRYDEVENVPVRTYDSAAGETAAGLLVKVLREAPNVVVMRDLVDGDTVGLLCREMVGENRVAIGTIRAKDCAEAALRVLALGAPPAEFAKQLTGVLCQRLVRRLCDKCKEAYVPPTQVLQQLGIPEGRIRAFYRAPQPAAGDEGRRDMCRECGGSGYKGQTAIFEFLVVDDAFRKALVTTPKLDLVRQAARQAGLKNIQEEGIVLVARGITSVPELVRVLK